MKNKLLFFVVIFVFCLALVSCGNNKTTIDWNEYTFVYGESADTQTNQAFSKLQNAFSEIGFSLENSSDMEIPELGIVRGEKEIVIGKTNRYDGDISLNPNDYLIDFTTSRLYIIGGNGESTLAAVDYFIENYIDENKNISIEFSQYIYRHDYPKLIISDIDISEYVLEYSTDEEKEKAEIIAEIIKDIYGVEIPVLYSHDCANVIRVKIDPINSKGFYSVSNQGGSVTITASSKYGIDYAIKAMKDNFFVVGSEWKTVIANKYLDADIYPESIFVLANNSKTDFYVMADTELSPISYKVGEEIVFNIELRDGKNIISCPAVRYTLKSDDGTVKSATLPMTEGKATLSCTISKPGAVYLNIIAIDENGNEIPNVTAFDGGAIANAGEITTAKETPADFEKFWSAQLQRLYDVLPTDSTVPTEATAYKGNVVTEYKMEYNNYYHIRKLTESDIEPLKANGITLSADALRNLDIYEVYLKSPGPTPTAGYLSVPKKANPASLSISVSYPGYSATSASIPSSSGAIYFNVTHHGYENGKNDAYYDVLKNGVCANYGKANGKTNSDFNDITDCYLLYMFLRDFQALRFVTDESLNKDIANLSTYWNGTLNVSGGSMGGYQTIGVSALTQFVPKDEKPIKINISSPSIPAWCNLGGHKVDGRINNIYGIGYTDNMDYFDTAIFAAYVNNKVIISRSGLGDYICPPSGMIAMYNNLKCEKSIVFYQNSTHNSPKHYNTYEIVGEIN